MQTVNYLSFEFQRIFWEDPVVKAIEDRNIVKLRQLGQMGVFFENIPTIIRIFYITIFFWRRPCNETYLLATLRTKNVQIIDSLPFHFDPNTYIGIPSEEGKQDYKNYLKEKLETALLDEELSSHYLNLIPEESRVGVLTELLNSMLNSEPHLQRLQVLGGSEFSLPLLVKLLQTGRFPLIDRLGFAFDANSHLAIQQHGGQLAYQNYCTHLNNKIRTSTAEESRHYLNCLPAAEPSPIEGLLNQQLASPQPDFVELRKLYALGDLNFQNRVLKRVLETENTALIDGLSLQFTPNSHEAIFQMGEASYRAYCGYLLEKMHQNLSSSAHFHNYISLFPSNEPSPLEALFDRIVQEHEPATRLQQLSQLGGATFTTTFMLKTLQTKDEDLIDLLYQFDANSYVHIYQNWAALEGENGYLLYVQYLLVKMSQNEDNPDQYQRYLNCFPLQEDLNMPNIITQARAKVLPLELKLASLQEALNNQNVNFDEWPHEEVYKMCENAMNLSLYNSYRDLLIEKLYQSLLNPEQFKYFLELFPLPPAPGLILTRDTAFEHLRGLILTKKSPAKDLENFYIFLGDQVLMNHSLSCYMNSLYGEGKAEITEEEKDLIDCIIANEDFTDSEWEALQWKIPSLPEAIKESFNEAFNECMGRYYRPLNSDANSPSPGQESCASPARK